MGLPGRVSPGEGLLISGNRWPGDGLELAVGLNAIGRSLTAVLTVTCSTAAEGAALTFWHRDYFFNFSTPCI